MTEFLTIFFNQYVKLFHAWLVMALLLGVPFLLGYWIGVKTKPLEKDNNVER